MRATYPNMKYLEVAYCLLNSPNVGLLLFMATIVVLLLVLSVNNKNNVHKLTLSSSMVNNFTNTPGYLETGQRLDLARRFRSARTSHTNHHSAECRACGPFMHRVQRFRTETARSASTRKAGNTTQDSLVSFLSQAGCGSGPKSAQSATTVNNRRCTRIWSRASHSPASSIATSFILSSGGKR